MRWLYVSMGCLAMYIRYLCSIGRGDIMPDNRIRSLYGSSALEPDNRKQFEGPAKLRFKIMLKRSLRHFQVIMQEIDTNIETQLTKEFDTAIVAKAHYHKIVGRILETHSYKVIAMNDMPQESIVFEQQALNIWSFPHED